MQCRLHRTVSVCLLPSRLSNHLCKVYWLSWLRPAVALACFLAILEVISSDTFLTGHLLKYPQVPVNKLNCKLNRYFLLPCHCKDRVGWNTETVFFFSWWHSIVVVASIKGHHWKAWREGQKNKKRKTKNKKQPGKERSEGSSALNLETWPCYLDLIWLENASIR